MKNNNYVGKAVLSLVGWSIGGFIVVTIVQLILSVVTGPRLETETTIFSTINVVLGYLKLILLFLVGPITCVYILIKGKKSKK